MYCYITANVYPLPCRDETVRLYKMWRASKGDGYNFRRWAALGALMVAVGVAAAARWQCQD